MSSSGLSPTLKRFVATVIVGGTGVVAVAGVEVSGHHRGSTWVIVALVFLGEMAPIRVPYHGDSQDVTLSWSFVFALLLLGEFELAILTQAAASAVTDVANRKPWWKTLFNAGQYAISVACTGGVLALFDHRSFADPAAITPRSFLGVLLAGVTLYVVNNLLIGVAIALSQRVPLAELFRDDIVFHAAVAVVLMTQAPLVVLAVDHGVWLVPLFVPAVLVAYRNARASIQRDHDAHHDALTGIPNRAHLEQWLRQVLSDGSAIAVLVIDVDDFRSVNDTLGHAMGDRLLVEIGQRLGARVGERLGDTAMVARLGGDEFAVVVVTDGTTDVRAFSALIARAFERPFDLDDLPFQLAVSLGCAVTPEHGTEPEVLLRRAEVAMYVAKERRSRFEVYSQAIDRYDPRRLVLLSDLGQAVERGQVLVYYQPKALIADGTVTGVEALVRWQHPQYGLIPPDEFIPLAEASGRVDGITHYLLEQAIAQCAAWRRTGLDLSVAVNVSPRNLHDVALVGRVETLLEKHRVPASSLEIEITENSAMRDIGLVQTVLGILQRRGVLVTLDDFGTGHSSLAHLRRLPVHSVKIDKSFVIDMLTNEDDAAIVGSTIRLAHALGLNVVAEGVESESIWRELLRQECDVAQGYYLSRPLPAATFETWLRASERPARLLAGQRSWSTARLGP